MKDTGTNYNNYVFIFIITIVSYLLSSSVHAETSTLAENYGPHENKTYDPARFHYSKKSSSYLTKLQGQLSKKLFDSSCADKHANLNMEYGQLFSPSNSGYLGFSYLSAKIDSANRIKFNTSIGHFIEPIGGDLFFTYRLLGATQNHTLPTLGSIDDRLYENSFSATYTRYSDTFLKETSLNYSFSTIPGDELSRQLYPSQTTTNQTSLNIAGGYGDLMAHEIEAQIAFGYERLGPRLLTGLKTRVGFGYEYSIQDALYDYSEQVDESVSLLAAIEQKTPFGLFNTTYKYLESSQTLHAGYSIEGVEFYLKETRYQDKKDTKLLGFLIKFDLWNPKDPFSKIKKLFGKNNRIDRAYKQVRHSVTLNSDSFSIKPKAVEFIDS